MFLKKAPRTTVAVVVFVAACLSSSRMRAFSDRLPHLPLKRAGLGRRWQGANPLLPQACVNFQPLLTWLALSLRLRPAAAWSGRVGFAAKPDRARSFLEC